MKKYIFFDFFGVISSEVSPIWFKRYFSDEEAMIIKDEIMSKGDKGELKEEEVYELIAQRMNMTPKKIYDDFQSLIFINNELVNYIKELKKEYKIYLLSNAMDTFLKRILSQHNLYELFDKIYISSEMKLIKPNIEFFNYVLNDNNIDPNNAIFIDDNIKNVEGAKKAGIDAILFTNTTDLKEKLNNK